MMNKQMSSLSALILLAFLYSTSGIFNRLIGKDFGAFNQQLVKNGIVLCLVFILVTFLKIKRRSIKKKDITWIIMWLLSGSSIMIMLFLAFNHLFLGTVYLLFYSTMIISGVAFGYLLFKEQMDKFKWISILLSLSGLICIYSVSINVKDAVYIFLALISGVLLGFWRVSSKKFSHNYDPLQLVMWDAFGSAIVGFIGLWLFQESYPTMQFHLGWFWIGIYAGIQIITTLLVIYGFKNINSQTASLIMPVEIVFATILGYLLFQEKLSYISTIGGICIILAATLPLIRETNKIKAS